MDHVSPKAGPAGAMRPAERAGPQLPFPPGRRLGGGRHERRLEVLQVRKGTAGCRGAAAMGSRSSRWCVLEAELVAELAGAVLRVLSLESLAPHDAAGKGRVCFVPFRYHLLQVARAHKPHVHWSVRVEQVEQPPI